jgi:signal peptidase II
MTMRRCDFVWAERRSRELTRATLANLVFFFGIALGGATLDLVSKWLAFAKLGYPGKFVQWPKVLSLTTSYNEGALWGIGRDLPFPNVMFASLSVLAATAILYWVLCKGAAAQRSLSVALGLIMAGTIGNCYDRIVIGKVRDWIYFELINWPIFNLADSWLVCGAGLLMLQAILAEVPEAKPGRVLTASVRPTPEVRGE